MATKASGIVSEIRTRNTKFGDMYDVVINGTAYGHGKYAPRGIQAGDFVTFEYDVKQNGNYTNYNLVNKSLRKDDAPAPAAVEAAKAETRTVLVTADKRQETISKQANLNSAIALVTQIIATGGIKFPASAKAPDIYKAVEGLVLTQAAKLYKLTTGETWDIEAPEEKPAAKRSDDDFQDDDLGDTVL